MSVKGLANDLSGERAPRWRIGQLSARLGVSREVLRAWEQRYGLLVPDRSAGGFRLYSSADEGRVRRVLALKEAGLATAEAVKLALAEPTPTDRRAAPPSEAGGSPRAAVEEMRSQVASALESFDEAAAHAALDRAFATVGVDRAVQAVILPALRDIGTRWEQGRVDVAQEHYATNLLMARLMALARGWHEGQGPWAVLACAPGELHVLGLLCFGLALRDRGWRVLFLGADTPLGAVDRAIREVAPALVVISAVLPERFLAHEDELQALRRRALLAIGGAGATLLVAERVGALPPQPDPVTAADAWGTERRNG